jgi:hypothetical protein
MLVLVNLRKEAEMYEQLLLFEEPRPAWVGRIWKAIDSAKRQEIVEILAEMGKCATAEKKGTQRKEGTDESC